MRKRRRKLVRWEVTSDHHLPLAIHLSTAPREPNFQIGWAWLNKNFRGELDLGQLSVPISFSAIQWGNLVHTITMHCPKGSCDSTSLVFDRLVKVGSQLNFVTYSCFIHGLCNVGIIYEAPDLIKEMVDKGIGPTASTYTLPLTSLCEAGCLKEACDLLIDMRKRCVCPNVQTHTGLIPGLFRVDCFKIAIGLFNKMLQDSVVTLINGYCKLGNLNNAMRLLSFMQENGSELDEWTFTEPICGFLKRGTLDVVLDMFNKVAACGLNPKKVSYTALIHGCCKREAIGLALSLLDKIMEIICRPKVHTYNVIFNGFCTQNRLPEAEKLCTEIAA
ncbi:pentatricopeptide repeat-containing protein At5g65560-like [Aristolochia californica]|uniref:pentatricopeptide repeat-containing protein At5g65560-like n=1 Tax=Aristolochia californica TaxID=171875 RepID=UPI0035DB312F